jgi:endogenous inhibitor of DNA gyrase (YacG/DUF329 family)
MIETRCPICDRPMRAARATDLPFRPFCSARCRRIDLGRWLGESYRIDEPDSSVPSDDDPDGVGPSLLPERP